MKFFALELILIHAFVLLPHFPLTQVCAET